MVGRATFMGVDVVGVCGKRIVELGIGGGVWVVDGFQGCL